MASASTRVALIKQAVISAFTVCCKNAEIAAILHDTKNCNFAVIAAMTADFAVQNSLYIIAKTATAIVMGFPEGWGDHSPHPFGDPPHHVGANQGKEKITICNISFYAWYKSSKMPASSVRLPFTDFGKCRIFLRIRDGKCLYIIA